MKTWGWSMLSLLVAAGCIRFPPDLRYAPAGGAAGSPAGGWSVLLRLRRIVPPSLSRAGFRLKLRYLSDQALNREYARFTFREPNLNPFTYGEDRDLDRGYAPPRFTVFELTVVNQSYPR